MIQNSSLSLCYCFAHEDASLRDELEEHLTQEVRYIHNSTDRDISNGSDWRQAMDEHLDAADVLLLLVTENFIRSGYSDGIEIQQALQRHKAGSSIVIPIMLAPIDWQQTLPVSLQSLLHTTQPITTSEDNTTKTFAQIATEVRIMIENWHVPITTPHNETTTSSSDDVISPAPLDDAISSSDNVSLSSSPDTSFNSPDKTITSSDNITDFSSSDNPVQHSEAITASSSLDTSSNSSNTINIQSPSDIMDNPLDENIAASSSEDTIISHPQQDETADSSSAQNDTSQSVEVAASSLEDTVVMPRIPKKTVTLPLSRNSASLQPLKKDDAASSLEDTVVMPRIPKKTIILPPTDAVVVPSTADDTIASPDDDVALPSNEPRNPYKGLRAFTTDDARDFFDHASHIDRFAFLIEAMLTREKKGAQSERLLVIMGPSGVGKSSIAMAGLLPCLQTGGVFDSTDWIYLPPVIPGAHPMAALVSALAQHALLKDRQREELQDSAGLHLYSSELVRQTNGTHTHVVLLVDQFEEVLTLASDEDERRRFLDLLVNACIQPGGPLIVVLTLRADFTKRFIDYPTMHALMQKQLEAQEAQGYPAWSMTRDDLQAVITQPALQADVQVTFEEGLLDALLSDTQGQAEVLPLLQFTLDELFRQRVGKQLTLHAYRAMGGLQGALAQHAEQTYQALPSDEHRASVRFLFLRLINPGTPEQAPTLRRMPLSIFNFADMAQTQRMQETIEAFVNARLLMMQHAVDSATLEISHEVLLHAWPRLADWLQVEREDIQFQQRFSEDATEWERQEQPKQLLYRGSRLRQAQGLATRHALGKQESNLLQASLVRHRRFLTGIIIITLLLALLALIAGVYYRSRQPTSLLVTNMHNSGQGSLRWCIDNAPTNSIITFDPQISGILTFSGGNLTIPNGKDLTIKGPGNGRIIMRSGDTNSTVVVSDGSSLVVSDLSFQRSQLTNHSIFSNSGDLTLNNDIISGNSSTGDGGAIFSTDGSLTLNNTTISGNSSTGDGGAIYSFAGTLALNNSSISGNTSASGRGGGIFFSSGMLTMNNSTISANVANSNNGGGIYTYNSTLTLNNDTISGNSTNVNGGGISTYNSTLTINNSTIINNTASANGGGIAINSADTPTVIRNYPVLLARSIITSNHAEQGLDIQGTLITGGYNIVEYFAGAIFTDPRHLHVTDKEMNDSATILIDGTLDKNGGPTLTHALLQGSPAIDAIPLNACDLKATPTDQRGVKRPQGKACDIGAVEYQVHP